MTIGSEMKKLTEDIASSHRQRLQNLAGIREETKQARGQVRDLMQEFHSNRRQAASRQKKGRAEESASRRSIVERMLADARGTVASGSVLRREQSVVRRAALEQEMTDLKAGVNKIIGEAGQVIAGFHSHRKKVSAELQKGLAESRSASKADAGGVIKGSRRLVNNLKETRRKAGGQLRKGLAKDRADRGFEVRGIRSDFTKSRREVRAELEQAATAWRSLSRKRDASVIPAAEPASDIPATQDKTRDLSTKLLAVVQEYPGGITLSGIAGKLGVAPIVLVRATKHLISGRKIRKQDRLYFPLNGVVS